jgi:hypothetical protein
VTLVKDGPAAAWEQIKTELSELKEQLISQITQMISTEVVKAAVTKLVSMLNPAGAVIQAIIAIYNTVTFFIEKINQIAAVVASFIDSISAIAAGQVDAAAKKVEMTMANTLTVVIAFLAKFAGLGGIPAKIVGIVKKIRQPIDKGLDKIVDWLGKMLGKMKAAISEWWKAKKPFTNKAGQSHTLSFSGTGADAKLMISTTTMELNAYLAKIKTDNKNNPDTLAKVKIAEDIFIKNKEQVFKQGSKTENEKKQYEETIAALTTISQALMELESSDDLGEYPNAEIKPDNAPPSISTVEKQSKAKLIPGTETSGDHGTHGWKFIIHDNNKLSSAKGDKWVQMHLVTAQLGGNAIAGNLIPAPNSINSSWRSGIEKWTVGLMEKKAEGKPNAMNVIWLKTEVTYYSDLVEDEGGNKYKFPSNVKSTAGIHIYKGKKKDNKADFDEKINAPVFSQNAQIPSIKLALDSKKASLNTSSGSHLRDRGKIEYRFTNEIKRNRPYKDIDDFETKMKQSFDPKDAQKLIDTVKNKLGVTIVFD